MTHTVFKCPTCDQKFKVSGGAHSCGLYAFSSDSMDYNLLEQINKSGTERVSEGMKRAVDYDDHCTTSHDFVVEASDDGF